MAEPEIRRGARVIFVGSCETFLDGRRIEDYLVEFGLRDVVELATRTDLERYGQFACRHLTRSLAASLDESARGG